MAVAVETLDKLERKLTLGLPATDVHKEVEKRLRKMAGKAKMDGFRPGKVPLKIVAERYGYSTRYDVVNERVEAEMARAIKEAGLNVAGILEVRERDSTEEKTEGGSDAILRFDVRLEVFPEIKLPALEALEVEKLSTQVDEATITRTINVLREQRGSFVQCSEGAEAESSNRATIDFKGKIDGEAFTGGQVKDLQFQLGKGKMLPEFEKAVLGMKVGESRTFPVFFPEDYHGVEIAGKQADFVVTLQKLEAHHLPEVDEGFVKTMGIASGKVDDLHASVRKNLELEVRNRLNARNKAAALDCLTNKTQLNLPQLMVQAELKRLLEATREDLKKRGIKDAETAPISEDVFRARAERRVKLGLVFRKLVEANGLSASSDQISKYIEALATSYEKPAEIIKWYGQESKRMTEVENMVLENNVADFIFSKAKVTDKSIAFDELMQAA